MTMEIESHGTEMKIPVSTPENRALVVSTEPTTPKTSPSAIPTEPKAACSIVRALRRLCRVWPRDLKTAVSRRRSTRARAIGLVTPAAAMSVATTRWALKTPVTLATAVR